MKWLFAAAIVLSASASAWAYPYDHYERWHHRETFGECVDKHVRFDRMSPHHAEMRCWYLRHR